MQQHTVESTTPEYPKSVSAKGIGRRGRIQVLVATGAVTLGALLAVATPAVGHATFDKKSLDNCAKAAERRWVNGETDQQTFDDEYKFCCIRSGGSA